MKIAITPNNLENAFKLIDNNTDILVLNLKEFSCRSNYYFSLEEIENLSKNKKNTKIFVQLSNFIFESQLEKLENILKKINNLNIDKVMFNDFSVPQICYEQNLKNISLHYQPNTLFVSYGQYELLMENNINSFSLSNELFKQEIETIAKNKPTNAQLMIQTEGLSLIMYSRWELVSNFKKYVDDALNEYEPNKKIFIKECNKVWNNIIYENEYGTHMFSGYQLSCLKHLKFFLENNIDYLLIDTFLLNKKRDVDLILNNIYHQALNDLDNLDDYHEKIENTSEYKLSDGFLGGMDSIHHLKKIKED